MPLDTYMNAPRLRASIGGSPRYHGKLYDYRATPIVFCASDQRLCENKSTMLRATRRDTRYNDSPAAMATWVEDMLSSRQVAIHGPRLACSSLCALYNFAYLRSEISLTAVNFGLVGECW